MLFVIIRWLIITAAIILAASFVPGIRVDTLGTAIFAAGLLGLINVVLRPLLIILTLPLNILTLGLFTFVINAFLLRLVAYFVSGMEVAGFLPALLGSLVISVVSWLANTFLIKATIVKSARPQNPDVIDLERGGDGKWR